MAENRVSLQSLVTVFEGVPDFRIDRHKKYTLGEILFLTLSAVISGFTEWEEIADFGEEKLGWLRGFYLYENGTPSHDTINRVVSLLDYRAFEEHFIRWATQDIKLPDGTVINVDGKKLRGSASKKEQQTPHSEGGKGAVHLVQAWCNELQLCLGQYKTEDKSNEITAIPALLEWLDVRGCIITIDAMGCQKVIAQQIIKQEADYVLGLKNNHSKLLEDVKGLFEQAGIITEQELKLEMEPEHLQEQTSRGHGRLEKRVCRILPAYLLGEEFQLEWAGLQSIVEITAHRYVMASGQFSLERRYYISSLNSGATEFNQIVRSHWAIENNLHWSLDVQFKEDQSRKRAHNAAANFAIILRFALSLLKKYPEKISIHRKQNKSAMSDKYREQIMGI
ncbi:MAG: ISAs1 family transposase [Lewinellaceae bacterium]|nr:ISAs1 family transposase [Lewinellaceae bacterium]MCB9050788.1 ISAs1 family transposase [Lewinellaceae bacterium]MCB9052741.1 ISAs1 family transposase [Lewinellaceae bacterium]